MVAIIAGAFSLTGCVDETERIVEVIKDPFEAPPAAAAGFLGYSDTTAQKTVCGTCHAGQQGAWKVSAHAKAAADLAASDHAAETCWNCHAVSELGSAATGNVGYTSMKSKRYVDVQCESCHNSGQAHLADPSKTQPLASIAAYGDEVSGTGCAECHNGTHHPYYEEWSKSGHAQADDHAATNASCAFCHEGKEALKTSFGVNSEYLEKGDTKLYGVTCAVCHDPHGSANEGQLRLSITARDTAQNLCAKCHQRRPNPQLTSSSGPHSPQGPTVLGVAGWRPDGFAYGTGPMVSTHGSEANGELCAGCHVQSFAVDATTNATGHLFKATPCIDASGKPTADDCELAQQRFKSCTGSGCHGSESGAKSAMVATELRLQALTAEVTRLVALVKAAKPGEFSTTDNKITVGEGANFNAGLLSGDGSRGVHNPFLIEALLNASITALKSTYGVQ
jgi:predicted CXXCH cytochrome family protein